MIEPVFVDTNVIVYRYDTRVLEKQSRADEWLKFIWSRHSGRVSTQVLLEFYSTITRKLKPAMTAAEVRRVVADSHPGSQFPSTCPFWNARGSCRIGSSCHGGTP